MEHGPFELSKAQASNSPDDFWKGFLGQKVTKLALILEEKGDVADTAIEQELEKAIADVPKNRQEFVSKNELLLRALERYAKEKNGFVNEKLEKGYIDIVTEEFLCRLREYDFDTVSAPLQEEIDKIVKEKEVPLREEAVKNLRDAFWERFSALKYE
jgi:hypothetical protein